MLTLRYLLIVLVILIGNTIAGEAGAASAEVTFSPDRVFSGSESVVTFSSTETLKAKDSFYAEIGGVKVPIQQSGAPGKLQFQVPKINFVGKAKVELLRAGKLIGLGNINFLDTEARSEVETNWLPWIIIIYASIVCMPPFYFIRYDISRSYNERQSVIEKIKTGSLDVDKVKELFKSMDDGPTGFTGLTRGIIAVTLILIVAVAMFHVLVFRTELATYSQNVLIIIANTITAITAFYFGAKAATPQTGAATPQTGAATPQTGAATPQTGTGTPRSVQGNGAELMET